MSAQLETAGSQAGEPHAGLVEKFIADHPVFSRLKPARLAVRDGERHTCRALGHIRPHLSPDRRQAQISMAVSFVESDEQDVVVLESRPLKAKQGELSATNTVPTARAVQ